MLQNIFITSIWNVNLDLNLANLKKEINQITNKDKGRIISNQGGYQSNNIDVENIIGGYENIGNGWKMLMECLAAGRAISLPSSNAGIAQLTARTVGGYARIRQQFKTPISNFEGISSILGQIAGKTFIIDSTRKLAAAAIDTGERPSVISAIAKVHATEKAREVVSSGMDIIGGKGICLGPSNFLAEAHIQTPISITVEGANILTRSLIIFGQGAIRCHPYVLKELKAAQNPNQNEALDQFDIAVKGNGVDLVIDDNSYLTSADASTIIDALIDPSEVWSISTGGQSGTMSFVQSEEMFFAGDPGLNLSSADVLAVGAALDTAIIDELDAAGVDVSGLSVGDTATAAHSMALGKAELTEKTNDSDDYQIHTIELDVGESGEGGYGEDQTLFWEIEANGGDGQASLDDFVETSGYVDVAAGDETAVIDLKVINDGFYIQK